MIKKRIQIFLCVFFFSFLFSKSIEIKNNENPVKDAEAILLQEKNFDQDSVSLKKFLAPLLLSKNPNHQILYYGLLANGYFNFYKKDNPESVDNYQKSINLAEKKTRPFLSCLGSTQLFFLSLSLLSIFANVARFCSCSSEN